VTLVVGGIAMAAQYAVTPVHVAGGRAADQVAAAVGHGTRMQASMWLDLLVLLVVPAALALGELAGRSRLATIGAGMAFAGMLPAGYLLATDVLIDRAVGDRAAVGLLDAYQESSVVSATVVLAVLVPTAGFVLLGIALVRGHAVPAWVGIAVAASAVLILLGEGGGIFALAVGAYLLRAVAFVLCAAALVTDERRVAAGALVDDAA
jgi:hypothetical protein